MNLQTASALALTSAALLGGLLAFRQQSDLRRLKAEAEELRARIGPYRVSRPNPTASEPAASGPGLGEPEKLELLRLRGEATRLRERVRELAGVRVENEKLRANAGTGDPGGVGSASGLPAGYVRRRDAQFAGFGTPEAALQSLMWAVEHQDTNVLFAAFASGGDDHDDGVRGEYERTGAAEFWKKVRMLPGYRVVSTEQQTENDVLLRVEMLPGEPAQEMHVRRIGTEWKLPGF